eukprot:jgi/Botrbrau1/22849/Bobra.0065s0008.1
MATSGPVVPWDPPISAPVVPMSHRWWLLEDRSTPSAGHPSLAASECEKFPPSLLPSFPPFSLPPFALPSSLPLFIPPTFPSQSSLLTACWLPMSRFCLQRKIKASLFCIAEGKQNGLCCTNGYATVLFAGLRTMLKVWPSK